MSAEAFRVRTEQGIGHRAEYAPIGTPAVPFTAAYVRIIPPVTFSKKALRLAAEDYGTIEQHATAQPTDLNEGGTLLYLDMGVEPTEVPDWETKAEPLALEAIRKLLAVADAASTPQGFEDLIKAEKSVEANHQ